MVDNFSYLRLTRSFGHLLLTGIFPQCVLNLRRTGKSCLLINATGQQSRICGQGSECTCCVYLTPKMREIDLSVTYVSPIALRVIDLYQNVLNSRLCVGLIWGYLIIAARFQQASNRIFNLYGMMYFWVGVLSDAHCAILFYNYV